MLRFAFFLFVMAGWGLSAAALYLVRSPEGFTLVTKDHLTFTDTWADTREWKRQDLKGHRDLIARMIGANRAERTLGHIVDGDRDELREQLGEAVEASAGSKVWKKSAARAQVTAGELLDLAMGN